MHMFSKAKTSMSATNVSHTKRECPLHDRPDNSWKRRRLSLFSWQPLATAFSKVFSLSEDVNFRTDTFSMMHKLRLLQLNYVQLGGSYKRFPRKLRLLCWHGFHLKSIPSDFPLESLVSLDFRHSNLEQLWKGTKVWLLIFPCLHLLFYFFHVINAMIGDEFVRTNCPLFLLPFLLQILRVLKFMDLSYSHSLVSTPDFSELPCLERLWLKDCTSLVKVHESIGDLEKLVLLNLKGCNNLRKLPRKIGQLKSLEKLILSGCSNLEMNPVELEKVKPLTVLHALRTAITQLYFTTGKSYSWPKILWSCLSKSNKEIGHSLAFLPCTLQKLSLRNCNLSDDTIPRDLSGLSLLLELDLSQNPISSLPESIKGLTMLKSLRLDACTGLQSLPELPTSLKEFVARDCKSLERMKMPPSLFKSLEVMQLTGCDKLGKVDGLFQLEAIKSFHTDIINAFGFLDLESMEKIEVELCNNLTLARKRGHIQVLYLCLCLNFAFYSMNVYLHLYCILMFRFHGSGVM